jgi:hypothetical protein
MAEQEWDLDVALDGADRGAQRLQQRPAVLADSAQDGQQRGRRAPLLLVGSVDAGRWDEACFVPGLLGHDVPLRWCWCDRADRTAGGGPLRPF